jgi:hypothetical protein
MPLPIPICIELLCAATHKISNLQAHVMRAWSISCWFIGLSWLRQRALQSLQPLQQIWVSLGGSRRCIGARTELFKGFALQLEVGLSVYAECFQVRVAQDVLYRYGVDSCLKQMHCLGMTVMPISA